MKYELEWQYVDDPATEPYIHFVFALRFPDVPPGRGHAAIFCFNVQQKAGSNVPGVSVVRRGFLDAVPFSKRDVQQFVETIVEEFSAESRDQALVRLNELFIDRNLDFSGQFISDLIEVDDLVLMIENAFDGVDRDGGITLHQATVLDNYGSEAEFIAAGEQDTERRWQDVPQSDLAANPYIFNYLDPIGFRYYLPAAMRWAVRNYIPDRFEGSFFTYLSVLPTIDPRDIGRGLGAAFDPNGFIERHAFTSRQVIAIYHFICFMAIRAGYEMDEVQFAAACKWRVAAGNSSTARS